MIVFEKVRYKNFLSTGNYFLEISLNSHNVTIVSGKNGAGKSTMLDALCYCLFNKGFRSVPKGNFINSLNGRDLLVEVEFSISGKKYLVRRGSKPNIFEIEVDGKMLDQVANIRDQQSYLEKNILRLNWKAFTQIIILGSATHVPFMQLKTAERREIIDELLDLRVLTLMKVVLKDRIDIIKEKLSEINSDISLLNTKINLEQQYLNKSATEREERKRKNDDSIAETHRLIIEENERIQSLNKDLEIFDYKELVKKYKQKQKKVDEYRSILSKLDHKISGLRGEVTFFTENSVCPTCAQDITSEWKSNAVNIRNSMLNELHDAKDKIEIKISNFTKEMDILLSEAKKVEALRNKISSSKRNIEHYEKFIEKIRKDFTEDASDSENSNVSEIESNIKILKEKEAEKESILRRNEIIAHASTFLKDNGIKSSIIKQFIPVINYHINQYLSLTDFFVKFEVDENFEESIRSRHIDDFKYLNFSEGEKKRIDLAILFAWRDIAKKKNSMNTNLIILDEVFDSAMDGDGSDTFIKIIKSIRDQNIFIITHKVDMMTDKFEGERNRVLNFEKRKNFSYLNETN